MLFCVGKRSHTNIHGSSASFCLFITYLRFINLFIMIKDEKLPEDIQEKLKGLPGIAEKDHDVIALFLFGSAVSGNLKPLSDIDLAVLLNPEPDKMKLFEKELEMRSSIFEVLNTESFDLVNLNTAPVRFVHNILSGGKILFCRNKYALADFSEKNTLSYLDFKYYRDEFDSTFNEMLKAKY